MQKDKMKNFISFLNNGQIVSCGICKNEDFLLQGENVIEGIANPILQYIENNVITDIPLKPDGAYVFDYDAKQWVRNTLEQESLIKAKRNALLQSSDWTQLPNNPLTVEKQNQWAEYRQQLRDVTIQSGYPFNVVWPIQPE